MTSRRRAFAGRSGLRRRPLPSMWRTSAASTSLKISEHLPARPAIHSTSASRQPASPRAGRERCARVPQIHLLKQNFQPLQRYPTNLWLAKDRCYPRCACGNGCSEKVLSRRHRAPFIRGSRSPRCGAWAQLFLHAAVVATRYLATRGAAPLSTIPSGYRSMFPAAGRASPCRLCRWSCVPCSSFRSDAPESSDPDSSHCRAVFATTVEQGVDPAMPGRHRRSRPGFGSARPWRTTLLPFTPVIKRGHQAS